MFQCRHCGTAASYDEPVPRDAECGGCGRDLRACVQCSFYDPAYNNACRETEADPVAEKERRNFCEFFSFHRDPFQPAPPSSRESEARTRLEGLFGGKSTPDRAADARAKLESLFRKPEPEE